MGRSLVILGITLAVLGLLLEYGPRLPIRLGRLPGDFSFHWGSVHVYIPLATCILLSLVVTLVLWLFGRR
jgi:Protein of unknown function (DUF2905)